MSDIKAYTVDINLGVKAGLSFVTEKRSLLRFQFYFGYTKSQNHFHSSDFVLSCLAHHYGLELNRDDYIRTITLPTLLPLSV